MANSIIQKSLQGDLNTLSARAGQRYYDSAAKATYAFKTINGYGLLLVLTQYDVLAIKYDANGAQCHKITNLQTDRTFTATFNQSTNDMVLTCNNDTGTVWGGIVVYQ